MSVCEDGVTRARVKLLLLALGPAVSRGSWGAASRPLTPLSSGSWPLRRYYFELLHKQDDMKLPDHVEVGVSAAAPWGLHQSPLPCPLLAAPPRTATWTLLAPPRTSHLADKAAAQGWDLRLHCACSSSFTEKVALSRFLQETFTGRPMGRESGARMNSWSQEQSSGTPSSLVARSGRASS